LFFAYLWKILNGKLLRGKILYEKSTRGKVFLGKCSMKMLLGNILHGKVLFCKLFCGTGVFYGMFFGKIPSGRPKKYPLLNP